MTRKISSKQNKTKTLKKILGSEVTVFFTTIGKKAKGELYFSEQDQRGKSGWYINQDRDKPLRIFKRHISAIDLDEFPRIILIPYGRTNINEKYGVSLEHKQKYYRVTI